MKTTTTLRAFHGKAAIKKKYLARVAAHRKADEIISGVYWEEGRGCAVGCTLHSGSHAAYETELGIPTVLARLEDRLFEGLFRQSPAVAKDWPERFLSAAKVGADLSMVWPKFALWLLVDKKLGVIRFAKKESTKSAIQNVGALYQRWISGDKPESSEWESVRRAAAYTAAAADAAAYAAAAAAYASAAAADAAAYAYAAAADAAAYAYAADARKSHYLAMADKLIELIEEAPCRGIASIARDAGCDDGEGK